MNAFRSLTRIDHEYRQSADALPALIWIAGTDGMCNWFNKGWLDFTGRSLEQEVANGWADGVHPDDLHECIDKYIKHFSNKEHFLIKYRLRRADGEYRMILDSGSPVFDYNGVFTGYHGVCFDITGIDISK